jgi:hypothetical protein
MKLWQLKNINTNEVLIEPGPLPQNWGPIFGLEGFKDKLGDLSWVGMPDKGWFEIEVSDKVIETNEKKQLIDSQIEKMLSDSLHMVAADNLNITKQQRAEWIEYRQKLKEIYLQSNYPLEVYWPKKPE